MNFIAKKFSPKTDVTAVEKNGLHPRNAHRGRYDFQPLIAASPELAAFVVRNAYGDASIDFTDPAAVRALNRALLSHFYAIKNWDIPPQYLCPPIPGRADYLHNLADLLAEHHSGVAPQGERIRALDIGTGANGIYPLLGHQLYGWQFVASDIDPLALENVRCILAENPRLNEAIELRLQTSAAAIFQGMIRATDRFDVTLCNPPFHASLGEATAGSQRKWKNLGKQTSRKPLLNFGGQGAELWCEGGEAAFVARMIDESRRYAAQCLWFTSLIAKSASLPAVYRALKQAGIQEVRTIEMAQGQKKSRLVAWSFHDLNQRAAWAKAHWK